jgi:hypothetical protein
VGIKLLGRDILFILLLQVEVKGELEVKWKVPYASKSDKIGKKMGMNPRGLIKVLNSALLFCVAILNRHGKEHISSLYNRKEETDGSVKMKVPLHGIEEHGCTK